MTRQRPTERPRMRSRAARQAERPGARPRPVRPPRPRRQLREVTLGEIADSLQRQRRMLVSVAVILLVVVYFPGETEGPRVPDQIRAATQPTQTGELQSDTSGVERPPSGDAPSSATRTTDNDETEAPEFDPEGFADVADEADRGNGSPRGGHDDGDGQLRCGPDDELPEPVMGGTVEEAAAAQDAIEAQLGEQAPVDVGGVAASAGDCRYGARSGLAELFVLSDLLPADDPVLQITLAPVFEDTCRQARSLALAVALASGGTYPTLVDAIVFCDGLRSANGAPVGENPVPDGQQEEELVPG